MVSLSLQIHVISNKTCCLLLTEIQLVNLKTLYSECFFHTIFSSYMESFNKVDK